MSLNLALGEQGVGALSGDQLSAFAVFSDEHVRSPPDVGIGNHASSPRQNQLIVTLTAVLMNQATAPDASSRSAGGAESMGRSSASAPAKDLRSLTHARLARRQALLY